MSEVSRESGAVQVSSLRGRNSRGQACHPAHLRSRTRPVCTFLVGNPKRERRRSPKKRPTDTDKAPLLTRIEVCRQLGVAKTTVRRLEESGELNPVVFQGVHYFDRRQVITLLKARAHSHAARAFALFEAGKQPVQVVLELDVDPEQIQRLWEHYNRMQKCWIVEGPGSLKAWEPVYKLGELTPRKLLRALELVCANPQLRATLLATAG